MNRPSALAQDHLAAPARRTWWRQAVGAVAALTVAGCASLLGPRSIEVSQAELQAKLARKFPVRQQVLGYLDVSASEPTLGVQPDTQRLRTRLALRIEDKLLGRVHAGSVQASFGLRYVATDQTVRLDQVRLDDVDMPTLPASMLDSLRRLGELATRNLLQDYVIKQFKPEDLAQADSLGYAVQGLRVTRTGLALDLVPKATLAAAR